MSGNSIGKLFTVTSFGESHGPAIGCIVDGCPAGLEINATMLQRDLDRRKPGTSKYTTQRREADEVEILSGVFEGKTTGTPIGLLIRNTDQRSKDYSDIAEKYRPGHADLTYDAKYGLRDYRGGGRSSARETAMRVAAGAVAKAWLKREFGTVIGGYVAQIGDIAIQHDDEHSEFDWQQIEENPFFCPEADTATRFAELIDRVRKEGNSIGARVNVVATNIPAGLGEPVFDRLDADIAHSLMSINAAKGVEIGAGFRSIEQSGSEHRDEIHPPRQFASNNAGGVLGGISSGQSVRASVAFKPTSSINVSGNTVNRKGEAIDIVTKGRHDPCVGIRAVPIVEAMLAITLMDHALRQRGQNGFYDHSVR